MSTPYILENRIYADPNFAIDGKLNTVAIVHNTGKEEYWQAEFEGGIRQIHYIKIRSRYNCCGEQLSNSKVYVGTTLCGTLPATAQNKDYTIDCPPNTQGDKVRVVLKGQYISMT
jgi:hypothetical protein